MSARELRLIRAAYWATCDMIDAQVGAVLDALERSGQRDNTLVIFMSDHGELLGDHGRTWKGPCLYEGSVHVPLIMAMPGTLARGLSVPALVELTDLAPTLLEAAGLPHDAGMQGRSLWPLLTGAIPPDQFRDDIYCEYYNANPDKPAKWMTMLRTARHKLVAVHDTLEGELYDLEHDPGEQHNLWDDPAHAVRKTALLQRLCARMAFTCDPLPARVGVF
jgi:arylsulfatase A-like enzyme